MPFVRSVLNRYQKHIVYAALSETYLASYSTVMTEDKEDRFLAQNPNDLTIFICSLSYYQAHEDMFTPFRRLTLVIADKSMPDSAGFYTRHSYMNLLHISASVLEVYSQFLACFHMYHIWRTHLNTTFTYANPSTIMPALSRVAGCAVYMYSQNDLILMDYSCTGLDIPFTRNLCSCFYLPEEIRPFVGQIHNPPENPVCGTFQNGPQYMLHSLRDFQGFSIILLFVYETKLHVDIPSNDFLYMISGQWEKHMDFQKNFHHNIVPTACDRLIALLSDPESSDSDIPDLIHELSWPLKQWNAWIDIHFPSLDSPALHQVILKNELQQFFPEQNLAFYQDTVTVLYSTANYTVSPAIPDHFPEWLKQHNAYAAIGPFSEKQETWREHLTLCKQLYAIAHTADSGYLFSYQDYLLPLALDRLQQSCPQKIIPVCYCHPVIPLLETYDRENNTAFAKVLFTYLYHSCNVNQAAGALFMHRNTVRKQIQKLSELFQLDLKCPNTRVQLLFSFYMREHPQSAEMPMIPIHYT